MKIKLSKLIVTILYALIFVLAVTQLRYQLMYTNDWLVIYTYVVYAMFLLSVLYFVTRRKIANNKWMYSLLILIIYEFVITAVAGSAFSPGEIIRDMLTWPLLSMVFCDYCSKKEIPEVFGKITIIGESAICILSIPNIIEHLATYGRYGSVIGPVYFVFTVLPLVYLTCNKKISIVFSAIAAILIVSSTKRLGFLVVVCGISLSYLSEAYVQKNLHERIKKTWRRLLFLAVALIVCFILMQRYNADVLTRLSSLADDGGSGRTKIWEMVMDAFYDLPIYRKLFGKGCHAVAYDLNLYGRHLYAHNSFMETMYDYGIIGLGILIWIVVKVLRKVIELHRKRDTMASALVFTVPITIGLGLFGYFFEQANIIIPVCVAWGICMGASERKSRSIMKNDV